MKRQDPSLKLLLSHPAHLLSLGFGSGLAAKAPGTVGTLAAWLIFVLMQGTFNDLAFALFLLLAFLGGVRIVRRTGIELGVIDHGGIVWDEFVAVWLVLWLTPDTLLWQAAGVLVFRFFDIVKPWPIRQLERRFKNAFGVMLDDIVAAVCTLVVLAMARHLLAWLA